MQASVFRFRDTATARDFGHKFGLQTFKSKSKESHHSPAFIHNLIVNPQCYGKSSPELIQTQNPKTSFYLCKRYQPSTPFSKLPSLVMKRLAYRRHNVQDKNGKIIYNDPESKNYDQIATEFHCYQLFKDSYRVVKCVEIIHENIGLKEDKKFFYQGLKLQDRRSKDIRNICFVLEELDQGSLEEQIQKIYETRQPFSQEKIIDFSCQIAQGLLQLKSKGVIHRDLRPQNILIHKSQIKFADFDSAFIRDYSNYKNIKNGVNMKETTPHEIMLLIAQSEDKLKTYSSQELYNIQQKADIYFLGVNIYSMVFSQMYESFNGGKVLQNLINIKKRQGINPNLLDLMLRCLEKDPHIRVSLPEVVSILSVIQRDLYHESSTFKRVYLGAQPMNLNSFSSNNYQQNDSPSNSEEVFQKHNREEMDNNLDQSFKQATLERNTSYYNHIFKRLLQNTELQKIWSSQQQKTHKVNKEILHNTVQNFLQKLQIKAYYYELTFRILCQINMASVNSMIYFEHIRAHTANLSSNLVILLTFLYQKIMKCSFISDPNYDESNPGYEMRKVTQNYKQYHSRWQFFNGRSSLHNQSIELRKKIKQEIEQQKKNASIQKINELLQLQQAFKVTFQGIQVTNQLQNIMISLDKTQYNGQEQRLNFRHEEVHIMRCIDKIESIIKKQMIKTIISLILAYQQIKNQQWGYHTNLKNIIFMIMILQTQNTKTLEKNDMVIIKNQLTSMIKLKLGWRSEQLQSFFRNYIDNHHQQVIKGLNWLQSQAKIGSDKISFQQKEQEEITIHINGKHSQQFLGSSRSKEDEKQSDNFITVEQFNPRLKYDSYDEVKVDMVIEQSEEKQKNEPIMMQTFDYKFYSPQLAKNISLQEEVKHTIDAKIGEQMESIE